MTAMKIFDNDSINIKESSQYYLKNIKYRSWILRVMDVHNSIY